MEERFEIIAKDGAGRIGRLYTKHGVIETPAFFPVVNPHLPVVSPQDLKKLGFDAFITNAYTLWKDEKLHSILVEKGIHNTYNWDKSIMTDSGAYQLMVYKDVEVSNLEIIEFQKKIGVDIGVILDVPVAKGDYNTKKRAIDETIRRAREAYEAGYLTDSDTIWVGPIHGPPILDLVEYSAKEMQKFPFQMFAIGSVVPLMEDYMYIQLIKSAVVAKKHLPSSKPIHVFGAGHPAALSLFVLLGFDTFDSAAYALYARDDRYFTAHGTYNLNDLKYFPCDCPVCTTYTPAELRSMEAAERHHFLALHHLYVIQSEIRRIKQAIYNGTLWQLVAKRVSAHPELARAYRWLLDHRNVKTYKFFEEFEPAYKRKGLLITRVEELNLPVIRRYKERLRERAYIWSDKIILAPPRDAMRLPPLIGGQVIILHPTFGLIPKEIRHVYPLFQHVSYLDDLPIEKFIKDDWDFIKGTLDYFAEKYNISEFFIYAEDRKEALELKKLFDFAELYEGQDIGFVEKDEHDKNIAKALFRYQFGAGAEDLIKDPYFEYSRATGLLRKIYESEITGEEIENVVKPELEKHMERRKRRGLEVPEDPFEELFVNKGKRWLIAAILPNSFKLVPHPLFGYRLIKKFKDELRYMMIINQEAEPFVREGKSIFSKFVIDLDENIRAEDEVLIINEDWEPVALAKAILGAREVKEFKRGMAAKNRWGFR